MVYIIPINMVGKLKTFWVILLIACH